MLVDVSRVVLESFGKLVGRPFCHSPTERQAFYLVVHRVSLMGSRASSRVDNRTQVLFFPFPSEFWSWHKVSKTKHVRTCEEYMWANNDARDSAGCVKLEGLVKDRMYLQTVLQIIWEFWDHLGSFGIIWDHLGSWLVRTASGFFLWPHGLTLWKAHFSRHGAIIWCPMSLSFWDIFSLSFQLRLCCSTTRS